MAVRLNRGYHLARMRKLLVAILVGSMFAAAASAQQACLPTVVRVRAVDKSGVIQALDARDLVATVDGHSTPVVSVELKPVVPGIVLALDHGGSMGSTVSNWVHR